MGFRLAAGYAGVRYGGVLEAGLWSVGLLLMAMADPLAEPLIESCLFKMVGLPGCPGCGLGHAIAFLARGEFSQAIQSHPASPIVVAVLMHRIAHCIRTVRSAGPSIR